VRSPTRDDSKSELGVPTDASAAQEVGAYDWTAFAQMDKCSVVVKDGDEERCAEVRGCGFCISG
jgi:hypothetical protein